MNISYVIIIGTAFMFSGCGHTSDVTRVETTEIAIQDVIAEVGCAACIYKMPGYIGCSHLAVVLDGKPHIVRGVDFTADMEPLCVDPDQAKLVGYVDEDEFIARDFEWSE